MSSFGKGKGMCTDVRNLVMVGLVICFSRGDTVRATSDPGTEWYRNPNNGHLDRRTSGPMSWDQAEAEAVKSGGHLATIRNLQEEEWIIATLESLF